MTLFVYHVFSALDVGYVEYVIDNSDEKVGILQDILCVFRFFFLVDDIVRHCNELCESGNGIERCTYLVAHVVEVEIRQL